MIFFLVLGRVRVDQGGGDCSAHTSMQMNDLPSGDEARHDGAFQLLLPSTSCSKARMIDAPAAGGCVVLCVGARGCIY